MRFSHLYDALQRLSEAIRDVETELAEMKAERDPLASHIFTSRRQYRTAHDTKSGKAARSHSPLELQHGLRTGFSWKSG